MPIIAELRRQAASNWNGTLAQVLPTIPTQFLDATNKPRYARHRYLQPLFYKERAGLSADVSDEDTLCHYIVRGQFEGIKPLLIFNEKLYCERWTQAVKHTERIGTPAEEMHAESAGVFPAATIRDGLSPIPAGVNAFLHWLVLGRIEMIIPTGLYADKYYSERYSDLAQWTHGGKFEHFVLFGFSENRRCHWLFDPEWYQRQHKLRTHEPALFHYLTIGEKTGTRTAEDVWLDGVPTRAIPCAEGRLEAAAMYFQQRLSRLDSDKILELVRDATEIEPLITRPYGRREVQIAPIRHGSAALAAFAEPVRRLLPCTQYDIVVLIPHCRLSGAARIAGAMVRALRQAYSDQRMLIVVTDATEFWRPDWYGNGWDLLVISDILESASPSIRISVLLDLIRGVNPQKVYNVNSKLAWDLFSVYGQQLSQEASLFAYLFCWDMNEHGDKGGYPITQFQICFDYLAGVIVDSMFLRNDLVQRYALPKRLSRKIKVIHTPLENDLDLNLSRALSVRRDRGSPLTCFWAGRFDRQKRFDIVVEIARKMPELRIYAWGKPVLGDDASVDDHNLPDNITLMGVYDNIDDIALASFDFFLYTSQWDGLPTVLIEVAARGIPIVCSAVGGIQDLINQDTAWPVQDILVPDAYIQQIQAMLADPKESEVRATRLRQRTYELCSPQLYASRLIDFSENRLDENE
jgi:glycosyltransferase involved in cell wall biosynthesis